MENVLLNSELGFYGSNLTESGEALHALLYFNYPSTAFFKNYGCDKKFVLYRNADLYKSFHFRGPPGLEIRMKTIIESVPVYNRWIIPPCGYLNTTPFLLGAPLFCCLSLFSLILEADEPFEFEACEAVLDIETRNMAARLNQVVMNTDFEKIEFEYNNTIQIPTPQKNEIEKFIEYYKQKRYEFFKGYTRSLALASKREGAVQRFFKNVLFDATLLRIIEEFCSNWARHGFIDNYISSFKCSGPDVTVTTPEDT